ncbi:hypothetical protein, partial [Rhizobium lusitanum]
TIVIAGAKTSASLAIVAHRPAGQNAGKAAGSKLSNPKGPENASWSRERDGTPRPLDNIAGASMLESKGWFATSIRHSRLSLNPKYRLHYAMPRVLTTGEGEVLDGKVAAK